MESVTFAKTAWDDWKVHFEKKKRKVRFIDENTFKVKHNKSKLTYVIEENLPEKIKEQFPDMTFSCLKIIIDKQEDYKLYFEEELFLKCVHVMCIGKNHSVSLDTFRKEKGELRNITDDVSKTEKHKLIAESFYNEILKQTHYRLRNITKEFEQTFYY